MAQSIKFYSFDKHFFEKFTRRNTKLTLTIEESLLEETKKYAKKEGKRLLDIVESYLKTITPVNSAGSSHISRLTASLRGSFKAPEV